MRTRNPTFLEHFSNENLSAVKIDIGRNTHVILCSIYMPKQNLSAAALNIADPIDHNSRIEDLTLFAIEKNMSIVYMMDSNSWNF
jgi:hypothetical protein